MVDLDVGEGGIELHIYIALPRRKLEGCHGGEAGRFACSGSGRILWGGRRRMAGGREEGHKGHKRRSTCRRQAHMMVKGSGLVQAAQAAQASPRAMSSLRWGSATARSCSRNNTLAPLRKTLASRIAFPIPLAAILASLEQQRVVMLIGLCGGKHQPSPSDLRLTRSRHLRG